MSEPIPQPPGWPIIGNIFSFDRSPRSISMIHHLVKQYGPIFKIEALGKVRYMVSSQELVNELCDEKRFVKAVSGSLTEIREGVGRGLFTAETDEHEWAVAHRVLVPAFGPLGIQHSFDEMYDIASQMVLKMAREGPEHDIDVPDMLTRLTLDSISLCAMDYRFNSFYKDELHPFVSAMSRFLVQGGKRTRRTRLEAWLFPSADRQFEADIALMREVASSVVDRRRQHPSDKKDLLNAMLLGKDPKTGEGLTHESIINNMITFLVAGHETTSGMLSFAIYQLLKSPKAYQKAQEEVDRVLGRDRITFDHISQFPYLDAVLRETLRLTPTAPGWFVKAKPGNNDPVILGGGKYAVPHDSIFTVMLPDLHRDPKVWGENANEFDPERCYGENWNNLPPNSFKAFGNGARGCIGRPFAWQEGLLALAMILQHFDLSLSNPDYILEIKRTLTTKPMGLYIRAAPRHGLDPLDLERVLFGGTARTTKTTQLSENQPDQSSDNGQPFQIFYGGNSGTCENLAQILAGACKKHGFSPVVKTLDEAIKNLSSAGPVAIITCSYEGSPADNAAEFFEWLSSTDDKFEGLEFAVFACGHHDWVSTYQKIPRLIDEMLLKRGGKHIPDMSREECDVAMGKIFDDFDAWQNRLWKSLTGKVDSDTEVDVLDVEISTSMRSKDLNQNVQETVVLENSILTSGGASEKRHMVIKLPTSMTYEPGDYLAVLPINPAKTVNRVLRRFGLPWDAMMTLKKGTPTTLPTEKSLPVYHILSTYVELGIPATRKAISSILQFATSDKERKMVETITSQIPDLSALEVLENIPSIDLPFSAYLAMLPAIRLRQYSISSSPLADPTTATITYSVYKKPYKFGEIEGAYLGATTNYLASLSPGSAIQIVTKRSPAAFHLPKDDENVPIAMTAAGTGIAPFMGFLAELAAKMEAAKSTGSKAQIPKAVLFFGCRYPDQDFLYKSQIEEWERQGVVKVYTAFSRASEISEGCKYVQDRIWAERETVSELFRQNAKFYICGGRGLGEGVKEVAKKIRITRAAEKGVEITDVDAEEWWRSLRNERYAVDVFE